MALDMVDEAVVNAKVVRVLPVYSSTVTLGTYRCLLCRDHNPLETASRSAIASPDRQSGVSVTTDYRRLSSILRLFHI